VRVRAQLFLVVSTLALVSACAPTVNLDPAAQANDPSCANMMVRLPDEVAGLERRGVNAQSTAAWGTPVAVIVRCGLDKPAPSTLPCFTLRGVDWLRDDADDPRFVFTTYGLEPATQVIIDSTLASGTRALSDLSRAVESQSTPVSACLDATSVLE